SAFLTTTFLGPQNQILIYQSLYANKGSLAGCLTMNTPTPSTPVDHFIQVGLNDSLDWLKPANSKDTLYKNGFDIPLSAAGDVFIQTAPGGIVLGQQDRDYNAQIAFDAGGLESTIGSIDQVFQIYNPGAGLVNKTAFISFEDGNSYKVAMPILNAATGAFSGSFTLPADAPGGARKITFEGLIVNRALEVEGFGYFLCPASSSPGAPRRSGRVWLRPW
ncbi:MAG TPA: hypothetical protein VD994_00075, partial [Prosthecobacter sp.]|nr:hypothetical protein [Prosthecobacter sp.]